MTVRYRLAVLTHGKDETVREAVDSFLDNVAHPPTDAILWCDGAAAWRRSAQATEEVDFPWFVNGSQRARGFCLATESLWRLASSAVALPAQDGAGAITHVFWLEHDFRLTRKLDLDVLARLMAAQNAFGQVKVAQMSLMRNAVNEEEKAAGGLYALRRPDFTPEGLWMSQRAYFTTNPSLMTMSFMRAHPWTTKKDHCEGHFTHELLAAGYVFGVFGDGSEYVEHFGARTGFGY